MDRTNERRWLRTRLTVLACALMLGFPVTAGAGDEHHVVSIAVGTYDLVRRDDDAGDIGIDYRIPVTGLWNLRPWIGVLSTSDQALWGGGGFYYDWQVSERLHLVPSFGAGFYEDGIGKDLGHTLEFRSQLDFTYRLRSDVRLGFNFGHLSNAGLSDSNKGTEYFNLTYTLPVGRKRGGATTADVGRSSGDRGAE